MQGDNIKITKGIKTHISPISSMSLTIGNPSFYKSVFFKPSIATLSDQEDREFKNSSLIFDLSGARKSDDSKFDNIIELLNQLKAAQSDQTVLVNNNTVVRQQILNELKNEILRVQNKLDKAQVQKLSIISNNNFDEDTLNELLKSLSEESKKKSAPNLRENELRFRNTRVKNLNFVNNVIKSRTNIIDRKKIDTQLIYSKPETRISEKFQAEKPLVYLKVPQPPEPVSETELPATVKQNKKILKKITVKDKTLAESLLPQKEITKIYKQNELASKELKEAESLIYNLKTEKTFYKNKEFSHVIKEYLETHPLDIIQSFIDKTYTSKKEDVFTIISKSYLNKFSKQDVYFKTQASHIEYLTSKLEKYTSRELINNVISKSRNLIQENIKNILIKTDNKINLNSIKINNLNQLLSYKNQISYDASKDKFLDLQEKTFTYLTKHTAETEKESVTEKSKVKEHEYKNILKNSLKTYENLYDKHKIYDILEQEQKTFSKKINELTFLKDQIIHKTRVESIENQVKNINKNLVYSKDLKNYVTKITNLEKQQKFSIITPQFYRETQNRILRSSMQIFQKTQENKDLYDLEFERKLLYLNKNINLKEIKKSEMDKIQKKNILIDKYQEVLGKINKIQNIENIFEKIKSKNFISEDRKIYKNIYNQSVNYINKKLSKIENIISRQDYTENRTMESLKNYEKLFRTMSSMDYTETEQQREMYSSKNLILSKKGNVSRKVLELKIKEAADETLKKTVNIIKPELLKRRFLEDTQTVSGKYAQKDVIKPTKIFEKTIKSKIKKIRSLTQKSTVTLPQKIKTLKTIETQKQEILRQVHETEKIYFNNIQEAAAKQLSLRESETVYRDDVSRVATRPKMVYKSPVNLREIYKKTQKETAKTSHPQRSPKLGSDSQKGFYEQKAPQMPAFSDAKLPKILKEEDVLKIVSSYLRDLNLSTISDRVLEKVEKQLETQRRMSGII